MKTRWLQISPPQGIAGDPLWANENAAPLLWWDRREFTDPTKLAEKMVADLRSFFDRCWPKSSPLGTGVATARIARPKRWSLGIVGIKILCEDADYLPVIPIVPAGADGPGKPARTLPRVQGPWSSAIKTNRQWFTTAFKYLRVLLAETDIPAPEMILFDIESLEYAGAGSFQQNGSGQGQSPARDPRATTVMIDGVSTLAEWQAAHSHTLTGAPMPSYSFVASQANNWACNSPQNDDARDFGLMPVTLGYLWAIRSGIVEPLRQAFGRAIPGGDWGGAWQGTREAPVLRGPGGRLSYMLDHCPMDVAIPGMYGNPPGEPYYGRDDTLFKTDRRYCTEQGWRVDFPIPDGTPTQCSVRLMREVARLFLPQVKATGRMVIPSICTANVLAGDPSLPVIPPEEISEYQTLLRGMMDDAEKNAAVDGWWLFEPGYATIPDVRTRVLNLCL